MCAPSERYPYRIDRSTLTTRHTVTGPLIKDSLRDLTGIHGSYFLQELEAHVLQSEQQLIVNLRVRERLKALLTPQSAVAAFASAFYFVRYDFYRINFIVGSRCGPDEDVWGGLVTNLVEELGGDSGASHNQLYRDFLREAWAPLTPVLRPPAFARRFNRAWEDHCRRAPLLQALSAIAIYEILDTPDYTLLLELMRDVGIRRQGLTFFQVHACADHFPLFGSVLATIGRTRHGRRSIGRATEFVLNSQRTMWTGLLQHLERRIATGVENTMAVPRHRAQQTRNDTGGLR